MNGSQNVIEPFFVNALLFFLNLACIFYLRNQIYDPASTKWTVAWCRMWMILLVFTTLLRLFVAWKLALYGNT